MGSNLIYDTAAADEGFLIDASGGNVTLTLPATPSAGDSIGACDYTNSATTNTITLARNSSNIEGSAEDLTIDVNGAGFTLVYSDATRGWEIVSEISGSSGITVSDLADGTDGELITWAADATPTTVAVGTADQVLTSNGAGAEPTFQDVSGRNIIKGWIQFNGTGTIAIQDSFNVSGITDNGVGDYTVTWDTNFANDDYSVVVGLSDATSFTFYSTATYLTSSVRIQTIAFAGGSQDASIINLIAIGDQ